MIDQKSTKISTPSNKVSYQEYEFSMRSMTTINAHNKTSNSNES